MSRKRKIWSLLSLLILNLHETITKMKQLNCAVQTLEMFFACVTESCQPKYVDIVKYYF